MYLTDADGRRYVDPDNEDQAAQEERTVPLTVPPPEHWRPALVRHPKETTDAGQ